MKDQSKFTQNRKPVRIGAPYYGRGWYRTDLHIIEYYEYVSHHQLTLDPDKVEWHELDPWEEPPLICLYPLPSKEHDQVNELPFCWNARQEGDQLEFPHWGQEAA